ncbi:DUF4350 domain-containing protein [Ichthyenterobacterium sp. W332]|uniref:DUF4350 domain-containing protein n=1 Tax=Microcosmobacter mediterraneus TaxID=3075607 RepID=A0ABU2YGD3_9FLAO|nr:DUF4350 domain-containing protein [Ichthyenterobacterium sp. W332]MDT0557239.1 DUF4350 domain-containing protein [Ichthyenterobacterium sp. W332]
MGKRSKIALYTIVVIIILMMVAEVTKPAAINWRDSYSAADKIPLGCYVLFNELEDYSDEDILTSTETLYSYLKDVPEDSKTTLLLINDWISLDEEESKSLADYVDNGNSVFISSNYFYGNVIDSLNTYLERRNSGFFKKGATSSFTSPTLNKNKKLFKDVIETSYFTSIDTLNTTVLGTVTLEIDDIEDEIEGGEILTYANFIKIKYGDNGGYFYLHSNPFAFTNYHMLNDNEDYAATVLSFLPKQQLIWDNYKKSGRKIIKSPLRFILTNTALKWAFYVALLALVLFVIFKGKRTQRIIPVIDPVKNTTVEFTQIIGDLYYQNGNYKSIIEKKITYFLEYTRTRFYLETSELNQNFIDKLALKSSNTKATTKDIIDFIIHLKSKNTLNENDLIELNKKIESFTKTQ